MKKILKRKSEETFEYPPEYIEIAYTSESREEGLHGDEFKEIIFHSYGKITKYIYSEAMLLALVKKRRVPYIDLTTRTPEDFVIHEERPELVEYEELVSND